MIAALLELTLALAQASPSPTPRPLASADTFRDDLSGGERAAFTFDVPANSATTVTVRQEGIDVALKLYRTGETAPRQPLDFKAGIGGEESAFPEVSDALVNWTLGVSVPLPKASRGAYEIRIETSPADDRSRARALARRTYLQASESALGGDGPGFVRARELYGEAAVAGRTASDPGLEAEATYQGARVADNLGDQPGAIEAQLRALEMFRVLGRVDREARVLNRLGDLSRKVYEVRDAERYLNEALPKAREAGDPSNIADTMNNTGLLMLIMGRYEDAIALLEAGLPLARELNSATIGGSLAHNLGEAYLAMGQPDKAAEWLEKALVTKKDLPIRRTAISGQVLAVAYFEAGDRVRAEAEIRKAMDLFEKSGDTTSYAGGLTTLGKMKRQLGETDEAITLLQRALPILQKARNEGFEVEALQTLAEIDIERGHANEALVRLDESASLLGSYAGNDLDKTFYLRALALDKLGRTDAAIEAIATAVKGVEATRGRLVRNDLRISYLATVRSYFDLYIDLLQRKGQTAAAFAMSERARARALVEGLAGQAAKIEKGADPALLKQRRSLQVDLAAKETYLARLASSDQALGPRATAVSRDLQRLLDELTELQSKIRASSPAWSALEMPEPAPLDRIQKELLDDDSAVVEYHLGKDRGYVWVVDRQSVTVHELQGRGAIEPVARDYHERLSRDIDSMGPAARVTLSRSLATLGRRLASMVLDPILERIKGKRLLVVADGALQYVPFASLPLPSGQPLVVRHEIVALPSITVLETLRRSSREVAAGSTAVFADPVFTKADVRVSKDGVAADAGSATRGEETDEPALRDFRASLVRLRFSRQEASAIVAASGFQTLAALDFAATKKAVLQPNIQKYRILHFATHGLLNADHPELSGLVFSLVDKEGRPVDGFLRLHEIYNLNLNADLVVLSACRTALGKEVYGEGLIGLTRGFMYAGASRVISTTWNVDDRASAQIMKRFYEIMFEKKISPAKALREAQLSMLRDPRWADPHYWAAFGLQGEWK